MVYLDQPENFLYYMVMEEWRKVPGYENYEISIDTKECRCRSIKNNIILNNKPNKLNRVFWGLYRDGKRTYYQAARWVALTFPELVENEYFEGAHIDHKDTDRLNCHPSNLRWVTQKENNNNPITRKHNSSGHIGQGINDPRKSKPVEQYSLSGTLLKTYPSIMQAARETVCQRECIRDCCKGKIKTSMGFIWKYK